MIRPTITASRLNPSVMTGGNRTIWFNNHFCFRCGITVVIVLLMVIMILTMSVKQYIYNKDPQEETTIQIAGCQMNISYIKMSDHYYSWEVYSSMSKWETKTRLIRDPRTAWSADGSARNEYLTFLWSVSGFPNRSMDPRVSS